MASTTIARTDDGTIQVNFAIPKADIDKAQEAALLELAKAVTIPGFRKGKAPIEKVKEKVDAGKLLEKTLGKILPDLYTKALLDNKIKPIIYPRFEIMKQGLIWEVQAKIAELPEFDLGDYKKAVAGEIRSKSLKKELSKEEKQDVAIRALLDAIKIKLPKILLEEEVNSRLAALLERTEKLGLKLENYLASIGKTEKSLREEYEKQVTEGISLELILNKIAEDLKIEVDEKDVETALKASGIDMEKHAGHDHLEDQKILIRSVLKRRAALDQLTTLS